MGKMYIEAASITTSKQLEKSQIYISIALRISYMPNNDTLWPRSSNELVVRKHWFASVAL